MNKMRLSVVLPGDPTYPVLQTLYYDGGILAAEPPEECRDSHHWQSHGTNFSEIITH